MHIIKRRGWELAERSVTPEAFVLNRRGLLGGAAALATFGATGAARAAALSAPRDTKFDPGRAITPEKDATTYNNYYEFSEDKDCWPLAQKMVITDPWSIRIDGLVKKPRTIAFEDLVKQAPLEERVYRHRCVEAWSMVVPWDGFPMKKLLDLAQPLGSAKYVAFTTVEQPKAMPGLSNPIYPWPYVEAVTIEEAANDLAFISVGMYGHSLPKVSGAPIRMTLPWKYGFKSGKAFVRISFVEKRPDTMWAQIAPSEYRLLGERQPRGGASPLEPGERARAGQRRAGADENLQRLRRVRILLVCRRERRETVHVIIFQRIMAVLAAAFLVGAVAVAMIGPPNVPLGAALYMLDRRVVYDVQAHLAAWMWDDAALPLLVRPAWLLPACIGVVCAGLSLSVASRKRPQRTPRRRS